jgi:hypothetical protein
MKKVIVIGLGLFFSLVILGGFYIYYNISNESKRVVEQTNNSTSNNESADNKMLGKSVILKKGNFIKIDKIHYASGEAFIEKDSQGEVKLIFKNFSAADGPDLFVYLSKNKEINTIKKDLGEVVSLGELKNIIGEQAYNLPPDYDDFNSVVIWCRAFNVNFSSADLIKN